MASILLMCMVMMNPTPKQIEARNSYGTVTILPTVRAHFRDGAWRGTATVEGDVRNRRYVTRTLWARTEPKATKAEALAAARLIRF